MARGWDSKSVEAQIESAESKDRGPARRRLTAAQVETLRNKEALELSRTRVLRELESSKNPRYQKMLKKALADLEAKLKQLSKG